MNDYAPLEWSIVVLVGGAGVGKTSVRNELAPMLRARSLGPDDHADRWRWVEREMLHTPARIPILLECCKIPRSILQSLRRRTIIELTASEHVRSKRLLTQGATASEVMSRLTEDGAIDYDGAVDPDIVVGTDAQSPKEIAMALRKLFEEELAVGH